MNAKLEELMVEECLVYGLKDDKSVRAYFTPSKIEELESRLERKIEHVEKSKNNPSTITKELSDAIIKIVKSELLEAEPEGDKKKFIRTPYELWR